MNVYNLDNLDGGLAVVDTANPETVEWLDDIKIIGFPSESALTVSLSDCNSNDSNLEAAGIEDGADIRLKMNEWLEGNGYPKTLHCDFSSEKSKAAALAEATAIWDRFLDGYLQSARRAAPEQPSPVRLGGVHMAGGGSMPR